MIRWGVIAMLGSFVLTVGAAPVRECISRFEFEAPGELVLPGVEKQPFTDEAEELMPYSFPGEQRMSYMNVFAPDRYYVSHELTPELFDKWSEEKISSYGKNLDSYEITAREGYRLVSRSRPQFYQSDSSRLQVLMFQDAIYIMRFLYSQQRAIRWCGEVSRNQGLDSAQIVDSLLAMFRPRATYEIPADPGVCVPYGFVRAPDAQAFSIGTIYRLKDHPDIEFLFEITPRQRTSKWDEWKTLRMYWEHPGRPFRDISIDGILFWARYPSIRIAGNKGKYSTATITNPDGTKDYGFAASYLGDTTDGIHKPEIFFYLHRTAARAIAAGIEPLDEDEVEDLAKQILRSLKWRKTEPGGRHGRDFHGEWLAYVEESRNREHLERRGLLRQKSAADLRKDIATIENLWAQRAVEINLR